jgi:hypothetical protein
LFTYNDDDGNDNTNDDGDDINDDDDISDNGIDDFKYDDSDDDDMAEAYLQVVVVCVPFVVVFVQPLVVDFV